MKDLIIIGAGDTGREAVELAERLNEMGIENWNILGFVDDNKELIGNSFEGYTVIGDTNYLNTLRKETYVLCAIGSGVVKKKIVGRINNCKIRFATLIDPNVYLCRGCSIGEGSLIYAGTAIALNAKVGDHVYISFNCSVGHDSVLEDYCSVYPGTNISGKVSVRESCEIGTGARIIQGLEIGEGSIIGAGAVVLHDIQGNCVSVGVPAKVIKTL